MISRFLLILLLAAPFPAAAHKLKVFAMVEGDKAVGSVYFAGGDKAGNVPGMLLDQAGNTALRLTSDENGAFSVVLPNSDPYLIRFESADGHMAQAAVNGAAASVKTATSNISADMEEMIARQLRPLRRQLDEMESRTRFSDVIGGLGFIIGLFGGAAWLAARRKDASS